MEFPFRLASFLGAPSDCAGPFVGIVDEAMLRGQRGQELCQVLEILGKASGLAQGLRKPVTTGMPSLPSQRIYLLASGRTALGLLKVGPKRLFVTPPPTKSCGSRLSAVGDALREVSPLCALDFYVHESCQRSGYGRKLFDAMLRHEGLQAAQLAYDRPSPKLKAFLAKHFGLARFRPQNNNYVIFDEYFECPRSGPAPRAAAMPAVAVRPDELQPRHDAARPPLPWHSSAELPPGAVERGGPQPPGCARPPGAAAPRPASERGRTPRDCGGNNSSHDAGSSGRVAGAAPAGMPSAGSQRARSTSAPLSAMGSSRSRVSSAGTDPGAGAPWGRLGGSAAGRFESPLSHAGRSLVLR
mmetsp:Transcript_29327/g.91149  ORF Transcript_29327/g.91149 Transcript_29327/m.91149 type:complete len:356 (+) Transcript_29327:152-1219(+)